MAADFYAESASASIPEGSVAPQVSGLHLCPDESHSLSVVDHDDYLAWEELRADIHEARGRYISDVNFFESLLNGCIAVHFGRVADDTEFNEWLLARLRTSDKIEVAASIAEARGIGDRLAPLFAELRHANELRNSLAHSHVAFYPPDEFDEEHPLRSIMSNPVAVRLHRKGARKDPIDPDGLRRELERLDPLYTQITGFYLALEGKSIRKGEGLSDYLDRFEAQVEEGRRAVEAGD
jgi:hypothetical protein